MFWLEMSRDPDHGGGDWGFGKCLWSPIRKPDGSRWAFWETTSAVKQGDDVLHLKGKGIEAAFVGFSKASGDGFISTVRPPIPGQWSYSKEFYRVPLAQYIAFSTPITLAHIFKTQDVELRNYFLKNKNKVSGEKRRLFYVIQAGRLQCLNGAYLSEVDEELSEIIFCSFSAYSNKGNQNYLSAQEIATREELKELKVRIGQAVFSQQVRLNYGHSCCFPGCNIKDSRFLVAAHIARWADTPALRGQTSNGICLCVLHDKAFEFGLFTITLDHRIWINKRKAHDSSWIEEYLVPYSGMRIVAGKSPPSEQAIRAHWARHGLSPT